jgi:hypothetical protein
LVDAKMKSIRDHIAVSTITKLNIENSKPSPLRIQESTIPIDWEWRFISPSPTRQYIPVNEDTIYTTIMDLIR